MNNRKGKIRIPKALYDEYYFLHITEIFKLLKVYHIKHKYKDQDDSIVVVEILGTSNYFREVREGELIPEYSVNIEKLNPNSKDKPVWKITFEPEQAYPAPMKKEFKPWPEAKREIGPTINWATKGGNVPLMRNPPAPPTTMKSPEQQLIDMIEVWEGYVGRENTPGAWQEIEELTKNMQLLVVEANLQDLYNQHFPFAKLPDISNPEGIKAAIVPNLVLQSKYNREDIEKSWEAYNLIVNNNNTYAPLFKDFLINETVIN